jgi:cell division protein FtsB
MLKSFSFYFILALGYLQYSLWFGWGGWMEVWHMQKEAVHIQEKNQSIKLANNFKKQQIEDLKDGDEGSEDLARIKLGMIKANEILVKPKN